MTFWWQAFFKKKRNPEQDLKALVESLRSALGSRLSSVVVFGSMTTDEFHKDHSDVNVLVVAEMSPDALTQITPALRPWLEKGHTPPILTALGELPEMSRSFPLEFLDMQDHHRVLWGDDPLSSLSVDLRHLRAQIEHDLAQTRLRLRQAIAAAGGSPERVREALLKSLPSVLTLVRGIVRLEENALKLDKIKAAERLAPRAGFDVAILKRLHDSRYRRTADNVKDLAADYLNLIDATLNYLRK